VRALFARASLFAGRNTDAVADHGED